MHAESENKFWRLLSDYEALTYQQAVAIRHGEVRLVVEAQQLKTTIFSAWLQLGTALNICRANHPELDQRLRDIACLESENLHRLEVNRKTTMRRLGELEQTHQSLRRIHRNYQENEIPVGSFSGFARQG